MADRTVSIRIIPFRTLRTRMVEAGFRTPTSYADAAQMIEGASLEMWDKLDPNLRGSLFAVDVVPRPVPQPANCGGAPCIGKTCDECDPALLLAPAPSIVMPDFAEAQAREQHLAGMFGRACKAGRRRDNPKRANRNARRALRRVHVAMEN